MLCGVRKEIQTPEREFYSSPLFCTDVFNFSPMGRMIVPVLFRESTEKFVVSHNPTKLPTKSGLVRLFSSQSGCKLHINNLTSVIWSRRPIVYHHGTVEVVLCSWTIHAHHFILAGFAGGRVYRECTVWPDRTSFSIEPKTNFRTHYCGSVYRSRFL